MKIKQLLLLLQL